MSSWFGVGLPFQEARPTKQAPAKKTFNMKISRSCIEMEFPPFNIL